MKLLLGKMTPYLWILSQKRTRQVDTDSSQHHITILPPLKPLYVPAHPRIRIQTLQSMFGHLQLRCQLPATHTWPHLLYGHRLTILQWISQEEPSLLTNGLYLSSTIYPQSPRKRWVHTIGNPLKNPSWIHTIAIAVATGLSNL
jgi:hypothetical protein